MAEPFVPLIREDIEAAAAGDVVLHLSPI